VRVWQTKTWGFLFSPCANFDITGADTSQQAKRNSPANCESNKRPLKKCSGSGCEIEDCVASNSGDNIKSATTSSTFIVAKRLWSLNVMGQFMIKTSNGITIVIAMPTC
jgi:hypothetical protein